MKKLFLLYVLLASNFASGDETYWDEGLVRSYVHQSDMQRRWAFSMLAPHLKELKENSNILDIGCGDGKITADISKFIPVGKIYGIDPSSGMLNWAKKQYHPLEYPNLYFQKGGFLDPPLSESFDLIVSFCALQHCLDQETAFKNAYSLLNPGGKLLILVPAMDNQAFNQAYRKLRGSAKWGHYWNGIIPRKFLKPEQYRELLKSAFLTPINIEKIATMDPFVDRKELLDWLLGTFTPAVPIELREEFYNECIDEFLKLDPEALHPDGMIYLQFGYIAIEAVR